MKAYLIPGAFDDINTHNYRAVLEIYKRHGYNPQFISITWPFRTIDDWVKEVLDQIPQHDLENSLLSGFSWGAMTALAVAAKTNPKQLFLFSLSPYFKEDMPLPPRYAAFAGKRRGAAFEKLSFNELARQIHCPTTFFIGSLEIPVLRYGLTEQKPQKIKGSKFILVNGADHDVTNPNYLKVINEVLPTAGK